ncbi:PAS domain S-box protein [bacterium]|nr:PAS domain S-box protein [bacterium]
MGIRQRQNQFKELKAIRKEREKGVFKNIVKHKEVEEELKEAEKKHQRVFEKMADGFILYKLITDKNGHPVDYIIREINRAAEKILSWNRKDVEGKKATEVYNGDTPFIERYAKIAKIEKVKHVTDYYPRLKKWYEITSFCPEKGYFANIFRDITALKESEERYHTVFENTGTATMVIEEDITVSLVNTRFEKLSGYSKREIENKMKWTDFVIPEDLERMKKYHIARRKSTEKPPTEYEFRMIDRKGKIKDMFLKTGMIPNTKKSIVSLTNITRRKRAEERIVKIQSLRNAISNINQLLVRVKSESELFQQICNLLIGVEEIRFVWIGLTNSENFKIKPVAQAGFEEGYLSSIKVTWDDSKYGNGPTGMALKTFQPFIMRNIEDDPKFEPWKNDALKRGYLSSIALPLIYKKEPIGVLNVYSGIKGAFTKEKVKFLKEVSRDITIGIRSLKLALNLRQSYQKLKKTMDATIETMSKIVEAKDPYTAGHQQRVCQLATAIAKELNLSQDKVEGIRIASLIHDTGKIGIPTELLSKPVKLTDIEFSLIKEHSQIGYNILKSIDFFYPVAQIILQHHERLDGSGYPQGLEGNNIVLEAKILGVADVVEAMSSHRPYRPALGIEITLKEISKNKGILYDPKVVDTCLRLFKEKGFKFK